MEREPSNGRPPILALVVTNLIKLGGLILGLHAGFSDQANNAALLLAAFMMTGAQGLEWFLKSFFGR